MRGLTVRKKGKSEGGGKENDGERYKVTPVAAHSEVSGACHKGIAEKECTGKLHQDETAPSSSTVDTTLQLPESIPISDTA